MVDFISSSIQLYWYRCTVSNAKVKKCCRLKIYQMAENCHAKIRQYASVERDGIFYSENQMDLSVSLIFASELQYENFQSEIRRLPSQYRKRKPDASVTNDISVSESPLVKIELVSSSMSRVFEGDYQPLTDENVTPSEDCDGLSDMGGSYVSTVYFDEAVELKLLDNPNSTAMYMKKPEKCHLMSQSTHKQYRLNQNNILYMSRFLHEYFDGISTIDNVPLFLLKYINHNDQSIKKFINGSDIYVYETTVRAIFKTEEDKNTLCPYFRNYTVISKIEIEFMLYFENASEFLSFCSEKEKQTREKWRQSGED